MGCYELPFVDSDSDGMEDGWEIYYFTDLSHDGTANSDHDGLKDSEEYQNITNPNNSDTDGDTVQDSLDNCPTVPNDDQANMDT